MPSPSAIILLTKTPRLGEVKTRLAKEIGNEKALKIYQAMLLDILSTLVKFKSQKKVNLFLSVNHFSNQSTLKKLWQDFPVKQFYFMSQGEGDLGKRIIHSLMNVKEKNSKLLIIGSDIPFIKSIHLNDLFNNLEKYELVVGPSFDGGYWGLGINNDSALFNTIRSLAPSQILKGVRWSSKYALKDTINFFKKKGNLPQKKIYLGKQLKDLDELADLKGTTYETLL